MTRIVLTIAALALLLSATSADAVFFRSAGQAPPIPAGTSVLLIGNDASSCLLIANDSTSCLAIGNP